MRARCREGDSASAGGAPRGTARPTSFHIDRYISRAFCSLDSHTTMINLTSVSGWNFGAIQLMLL